MGWRASGLLLFGVILIWIVLLASLLVYRNRGAQRNLVRFSFLCVIMCVRQLTELNITVFRVYICTEGSMCELLVCIYLKICIYILIDNLSYTVGN